MCKVNSSWKEAKQDELKAKARICAVQACLAQETEKQAGCKLDEVWAARVTYMLAVSNGRHTQGGLEVLFDCIALAVDYAAKARHTHSKAVAEYSDRATELHKLKNEIEAAESASLPDLNDTKLFNAQQ